MPRRDSLPISQRGALEMFWVALFLIVVCIVLAIAWVLFRAALAALSEWAIRYPCLPRRKESELANTPLAISRREARRRTLQRERTMQELRGLTEPR